MDGFPEETRGKRKDAPTTSETFIEMSSLKQMALFAAEVAYVENLIDIATFLFLAS